MWGHLINQQGRPQSDNFLYPFFYKVKFSPELSLRHPVLGCEAVLKTNKAGHKATFFYILFSAKRRSPQNYLFNILCKDVRPFYKPITVQFTVQQIYNKARRRTWKVGRRKWKEMKGNEISKNIPHNNVSLEFSECFKRIYNGAVHSLTPGNNSEARLRRSGRSLGPVSEQQGTTGKGYEAPQRSSTMGQPLKGYTTGHKNRETQNVGHRSFEGFLGIYVCISLLVLNILKFIF